MLFLIFIFFLISKFCLFYSKTILMGKYRKKWRIDGWISKFKVWWVNILKPEFWWVCTQFCLFINCGYFWGFSSYANFCLWCYRCCITGAVKDSVVGEERIAKYLLSVLNTRRTPLHWGRLVNRSDQENNRLRKQPEHIDGSDVVYIQV